METEFIYKKNKKGNRITVLESFCGEDEKIAELFLHNGMWFFNKSYNFYLDDRNLTQIANKLKELNDGK